MFDKRIVVDGSLRNVSVNGRVTGYSVDTRIPYYRGLGLSMVQEELTVDGERVDPARITFTVHGNEYRMTQLGEVLDDRWGFTEPATLTVEHDGGLAAGDHTVEVTALLRISYTPSGSATTDRKTLAVQDAA